MVPLARGVRAFLAWQTTHPAFRVRTVRDHGRALDRENVAIARGDFGFVPVKNLQFDRFGERLAADGQRAAPDKATGVAAGLHMLPLKLENKIFVLARGAQHARRHAGGHDDAVAYGKCAGCAIHIGPAGEVASVEEGRPVLRRERNEPRDQESA